LLTINYPFDYHFNLIKPFIFSFVLILFTTVLTQGMYSFLSRQGKFFTLALISLITLYVLLFNQLNLHEIDLWKVMLFSLINIVAIYYFLKSKKRKNKELILNIFALISLFIFYL